MARTLRVRKVGGVRGKAYYLRLPKALVDALRLLGKDVEDAEFTVRYELTRDGRLVIIYEERGAE